MSGLFHPYGLPNQLLRTSYFTTFVSHTLDPENIRGGHCAARCVIRQYQYGSRILLVYLLKYS